MGNKPEIMRSDTTKALRASMVYWETSRNSEHSGRSGKQVEVKPVKLEITRAENPECKKPISPTN